MKFVIPDHIFGHGDECAFTFESIQRLMQNQSPKFVEKFKACGIFIYQNDTIEMNMRELLPKMKQVFNQFFKYTNSNYECTQVAFTSPIGVLVFVKKLPE